MSYPTRETFVANTDRAWFDFLVTRAVNGRQRLQHIPTSAASQPSRDALAWHLEHVFKKTG